MPTLEETRNNLASALEQGNDEDKCGAIHQLGIYGDASGVFGLTSTVAQMLDHPSRMVKREALLAIGKMGEVGAVYTGKVAMLLRSQDAEIVVAACDSLAYMQEVSANFAGDVEPILTHADYECRAAAVNALGCMKAKKHVQDILRCLNDKEHLVVQHAVKSLAKLAVESKQYAPQIVSKTSESKNPVTRSHAITFLLNAGAEVCMEYKKVLIAALSDEDPVVRRAACDAFAKHAKEMEPLAKELGGFLSASEGRLRAAAAACLGELGEAAGDQASALAGLLKDNFEDELAETYFLACVTDRTPVNIRISRVAAAVALSKIGESGHKYVSEIGDLLNDKNDHVRRATADALGNMGAPAAKLQAKLMEVSSERNVLVAAAALEALGKSMEATRNANAKLVDLGAKKLKHQHPAVRVGALKCLGGAGFKASAHADNIAKCFSDRAGSVRAAAAWAMARIGTRGRAYACEVARLTYDFEIKVQVEALKSLPLMGEQGCCFAEEIVEHLSCHNPAVRIATLEALGDMGEDAKEAMVLDKISEQSRTDTLKRIRELAFETESKLQ